MKNDYNCLFSYIQEKRNEPQLSLLDWIHDNNVLPAPESQKDILKEYYEKAIHFRVRLRLEVQKKLDVQQICLRSHFLAINYPLDQEVQNENV